jgi:hypothetical protein
MLHCFKPLIIIGDMVRHSNYFVVYVADLQHEHVQANDNQRENGVFYMHSLYCHCNSDHLYQHHNHNHRMGVFAMGV